MKPEEAARLVDEGLEGVLRGIRKARDHITAGHVMSAQEQLESAEYILDVLLNGAQGSGPAPDADDLEGVERVAERGGAP